MRGDVISSISTGFPELSQSLRQVAHVLHTRSPLIQEQAPFIVRLACVKHAASVRPEPGSNSPLKTHNHPEGAISQRQKSQITSIKTQTSSNTDHPRRKNETISKYPPHRNDGAEYQKYLALTFIGTLLSSQRTRAHHHAPDLRPTRSEATVPAYFLILTNASPCGFRNQGRLETLPEGSWPSHSQAPSSNLVVPFLSARVGVRVALTWNKLREHLPEHQIASSMAVSMARSPSPEG